MVASHGPIQYRPPRLTIGRIIDRAAAGNTPTGLFIWLGFLLVVRAALSAIAPLTASDTATKVESDLQARVLDAVLQIGPWSGRRTGETVAKATEGVDAVGSPRGDLLPPALHCSHRFAASAGSAFGRVGSRTKR